eukprot:COSAG05_NODE_2078_length_3573_cov_13.642694_1_plen_50_part_00
MYGTRTCRVRAQLQGMHACAQCKFACLRAQQGEKFLLILLISYDPKHHA